MFNNYVAVLKKYVEFGGRAGRPEFWWFALANFIIWSVLSLVRATLAGIYSLAVLLPSLAVAARRLRDAGFTPWLLLLYLIPVIGWIALLVLYCMPSKK